MEISLNLIKDKSEEIAEIRWTVTGKVSDVIRTNGSSKPDLHFDYDAMGQRIAKTVTNKNTTDGTDKFVTTYYVRDPQGNVMAVISDEASDTNEPTVVSLSDYYPYGMTEPGRSWNAYRYGFNLQENQNINNLLTDGVNLLATMTKKQQ